ncbi:MAG TPA: DoxX family protein [Propionibacteriaceae bacterium]|nr:DoxX family protein [Propionibacteriaceae bacterium]
MGSRWLDAGLLALRLGVGSAVAAHGAQKLFGWFGGYGPDGTGQWMDSLGFAGDGKRNALLSGAAEFGGGTLLALGLATGPAGAAVTGNMIVAGSTHAPNGFFNTNGGYELPATYALVGSTLALIGPGRFSLDRATGNVFNRRWMAFAGLMSTIAGAAYMITTRQPPEPVPDEVDAAESPTGDVGTSNLGTGEVGAAESTTGEAEAAESVTEQPNA